MKRFIFSILLLGLALGQRAAAQTATVNWSATHQTIDGFGAMNAATATSMSSADEALFFGTGPGQLGLSILRVGLSDDNYDPGNCSTVSAGCAGAYVNDMKAVIANGGHVYATPFSPPAAYKTNGSAICNFGSGNGQLITGDYAAYATWMANFVQSVQSQGASIYALDVQNEPEICPNYDGALWNASQLNTFVKNNLGPTFKAAGLSTLIFMPEVADYFDLASYAGACMTDSSCYQYLGGNNWHDYDSNYSAPGTVNSTPNPWASLGKKYWQTEASCPNSGLNFCQGGFVGDMSDALPWAAIIDHRLAIDNANAWLYLEIEDWFDDGSNIGLTPNDNANGIAKRGYVLGQYSKFVRPGWVRIDATHSPAAGVLISAFKDPTNTQLAIVAVNTGGSDQSVTFSLGGGASFGSVTPIVTSPSSNLATQSTVGVSSNSFTYTLPASSVTTFVGDSSATFNTLAPPTQLRATVQ